MPKPGKLLILGAGPTGIGAAHRLLEKGFTDFLVLEATDHPGGLAASFVDPQGFTWDVGGHVQFSHYEYFDRKMDEALGKDGWFYHERASYVWTHGRFVPYPFQNNIHHLPESIRDRCLKGLREAAAGAASARPKNFGDWALATFGRGIFDVFMSPYNFKVWAYPLETMAFHWIGDRVSVVNVDRIEENIRLGRDDISWGPNNRFRFPKHGGTGAIWKALAAKIPAANIRYGCPVENVNLKQKTVVAGGEELSFERMLTSLPLDHFCELTGEDDLLKRAKGMVYSTANIVGIGLKGSIPTHLQGKCWMYFPEDNSPFYRVTVFSHYSENNVPDPKKYWSLMAETSESAQKPVNVSMIVAETIQGLKNAKLISEGDEIVSTWSIRAEHGYPTPFLKRDSLIDPIQKHLEKSGISSRGRFGAWKYEVSNQDHSFMQGVEWVDHLLEGKPEVTFENPNLVNRGPKVPA